MCVCVCVYIYICIFVVQSLSCIRLFCNPMDYRPPGSSIHGIFQARVLEWGAIAFSFPEPRWYLKFLQEFSFFSSR